MYYDSLSRNAISQDEQLQTGRMDLILAPQVTPPLPLQQAITPSSRRLVTGVYVMDPV